MKCHYCGHEASERVERVEQARRIAGAFDLLKTESWGTYWEQRAKDLELLVLEAVDGPLDKDCPWCFEVGGHSEDCRAMAGLKP